MHFYGRLVLHRQPAPDPEYPTAKGRRKDGRDLTSEWVATRGPGAAYVWNKAQFDAIAKDLPVEGTKPSEKRKKPKR